MAARFNGKINIDIGDSESDWTPFEPPKAPEGAPNVVYIVLDDVGFSAMGSYGGPIETPNGFPNASGTIPPAVTGRQAAVSSASTGFSGEPGVDLEREAAMMLARE
jgi:hypothetical protein